MKKKEIYYELWATLDKARDFAYYLDDKELIKVLTKFRRKYLNLSGVGKKVINQINKEILKELKWKN